MGLDIGGNQITQNGSVLTINTGASMALLLAGAVRRPNQCQFIAHGSSTAAWVRFVVGWNKLPCPTASVNVNACYDTANTRFVAPVAGIYFFQASVFLNKIAAIDSHYMHPLFAVNGSFGAGTVNPDYPDYRIRGYGQPTTAYLDTHVTQIYSLAAGDYVEHYCFSNVTENQWYQPYLRFTGFLLG